MPVNIEKRKKRYKREAVLGVCVCILLLLPCAAVCGALCLFPPLPWWAKALAAAGALLCLLPAGFALAVLRERFRELDRGELDAAVWY